MRRCLRTAILLACLTLGACLLFSAAFSLASATSEPPTARIDSVSHPDHVLPNEVFPVTITVDYSDSFLADVGIWDPNTGLMVHSVTLISSFTGPGRTNFTFQLTAPKTGMDWQLVAMTRVWWEDAWYQDPNGATQPFEVTVASNKIMLTLSSQLDNSTIKLDGAEYAVGRANSVQAVVKPGVHSLAADQIIQTAAGERFIFTHWSDGVNSNPRSILIATDTNIVAEYRAEFYLTVNSPAGRVYGEGWYPKGYNASFGVTPSTYSASAWFGFLTGEYHFAHWSGDSDSTSQVASVLMNGPKNVSAQWAQTGTRLDIRIITTLMSAGCIPLAAIGLYRYSKRSRTSSRRILSYSGKPRGLPILLLLVLLLPMAAPMAHAQLPIQPKASVVKIGDAYWYYWNRTSSDTCLLWLGGGISQETASYNFYYINPFDFESFGTIHFVLDLTKYYCVIALAKGSVALFDAEANRTIYQEPYQIQSTIISSIHQWIRQLGYSHTYLVGYSVGAQVAAMEASLRDPQGWSGSDGLVLITVPLEDTVILHAHDLRANLLILYGGNLPDFVATGERFYNNTQPEGWRGSYYFDKEFYVLDDVGHEVWTVRDTGAYTTRALNIVVGFIERSKALQYSQQTSSIAQMPGSGTLSTLANGTITVTSITAPAKVAPNSIFSIEANVSYQLRSPTQIALLSYSKAGLISSNTAIMSGEGNKPLRLLVPPLLAEPYAHPAQSSQNSTQLSLYVVLLVEEGEKWLPIATLPPVTTTVTDLVTLTINTSMGGMSIMIDGIQYVASAKGLVQVEVMSGTHTLQGETTIDFDNFTRIVFTQWDDSSTNPTRQITVANDTTLTAFYRRQYFVNASSDYGVVQGSGWYDENSTAELQVQPPLIPQRAVGFDHWTGDASGSSPQTILTVNSPKAAQAVWSPISVQARPSYSSTLWLAISAITFIALLMWNLAQRSRARGVEPNSSHTTSEG
jgi:hypothetical protein